MSIVTIAIRHKWMDIKAEAEEERLWCFVAYEEYSWGVIPIEYPKDEWRRDT